MNEYVYNGPTVEVRPVNRGFHIYLCAEGQDFIEYAISVKAEVNINLAIIKSVYNEHHGCWQEIEPIYVAAKYLKPIKPETIDFTNASKDDFVDVLYETLRKVSTKFGYPFPDESCTDDCKKALKKNLIEKFDRPSEKVLDIIRRMSREHKEDNHEVGGDHYKMAIEPWDFIYANHIPFDEGSAIKYLCRHKDKNGAEDVKKAISFCKHILKTQYGE